jgi:aminopeptidase N
MKHISIISIFLFCLTQLFAQNHYTRFESIDVQNYIFEIHLNDSTNVIEGKATVRVKFLKPAQKVTLDLIGLNDSTSFGMEVSQINFIGNPMRFSHQNGQLEIDFNQIFKIGETIEFEVVYSGIPADGLIISKNKFGDRTFFGDNWPDRARFWLPTVDHPSDKATLEFRVFAPEKYQVVSNGFQLEEANLNGGMKYTCWKENVPISTKIMVIGVARFAVRQNENHNSVPVSSWVFPQNRDEGFLDYSVGDKALGYYSEIIGPYSYEKLAHVQSKTRYGGMENAGCIFYAENSVTGKNQDEGLIAHETAHQWFGNSVTERNWHHVWLSEGFATYLTHLYNEHFFGEEFFRQSLIKDRERVIRFANKKLAPVIDTTIVNYNFLLNANSYQKASWFLYMLQEKVGDSIFFKSLQKYYLTFKDSTVLTSDFQNIVEEVSNQNLENFFYQWLYQSGFPKLKVDWKQNNRKELILKIDQVQKNYLFTFPIEIEIRLKNGDKIYQILTIKDRETKIDITLNERVESIVLDPAIKLLFEEIR